MQVLLAGHRPLKSKQMPEKWGGGGKKEEQELCGIKLDGLTVIKTSQSVVPSQDSDRTLDQGTALCSEQKMSSIWRFLVISQLCLQYIDSFSSYSKILSNLFLFLLPSRKVALDRSIFY